MSRESLNPDRLDAFLRFLKARGCDSRPGNGAYEVVQVRLPEYDAWYPIYRRAKPANAWLSPDGRLDALLREFDLLPTDPLNSIPDPDATLAEHRKPPTDAAERRVWAVFGLDCEGSVNGRWVGSIFSDGLQLDGNFTLEELEKVVAAWKGAA